MLTWLQLNPITFTVQPITCTVQPPSSIPSTSPESTSISSSGVPAHREAECCCCTAIIHLDQLIYPIETSAGVRWVHLGCAEKQANGQLKPPPCKRFLSNGSCQRDGCVFAHTKSGTSTLSNGTAQPEQPHACRHWARGHCRHGTCCRFAHSSLPRAELSPVTAAAALERQMHAIFGPQMASSAVYIDTTSKQWLGSTRRYRRQQAKRTSLCVPLEDLDFLRLHSLQQLLECQRGRGLLDSLQPCTLLCALQPTDSEAFTDFALRRKMPFVLLPSQYHTSRSTKPLVYRNPLTSQMGAVQCHSDFCDYLRSKDSRIALQQLLPDHPTSTIIFWRAASDAEGSVSVTQLDLTEREIVEQRTERNSASRQLKKETKQQSRVSNKQSVTCEGAAAELLLVDPDLVPVSVSRYLQVHTELNPVRVVHAIAAGQVAIDGQLVQACSEPLYEALVFPGQLVTLDGIDVCLKSERRADELQVSALWKPGQTETDMHPSKPLYGMAPTGAGRASLQPIGESLPHGSHLSLCCLLPCLLCCLLPCRCIQLKLAMLQ